MCCFWSCQFIRGNVDPVGCFMFFSGLISMFIFDVLWIPSGCIQIYSGCIAPVAPPSLWGCIKVFWNVMLHRLVNVYHHFGGTSSLFRVFLDSLTQKVEPQHSFVELTWCNIQEGLHLEPKDSLLCSQGPVSCVYPEPYESSPCNPILFI